MTTVIADEPTIGAGTGEDAPGMGDDAPSVGRSPAGYALLAVRVASVAWTVSLVALLLGLAVLVLAGWRLDIVTSPSMEPAIPKGSAVLAEPADIEMLAALEVGDVITFRGQQIDTLVMHRIVEVVDEPSGRSFVTQGDANAGTDPGPVPGSEVVAKVRGSVPAVGSVLQVLRPPFGVLVLVVAPLLLALAKHRLARAAAGTPLHPSTDHAVDPTS